MCSVAPYDQNSGHGVLRQIKGAASAISGAGPSKPLLPAFAPFAVEVDHAGAVQPHDHRQRVGDAGAAVAHVEVDPVDRGRTQAHQHLAGLPMGPRPFADGDDLVAAMDKLSAIAEQPMEDVGGLDVPRQRGGGSLEFKNVALAFDGAGVLRDITLDIPSGSRVGIVGPSGAGKSTILELAAGLFEADRGRVAINGVDVRTSDLASLRSRIGYVFPDNQLIPGTVLDNILLGRKFPVSDIDWALSMVRLDRDISKLEYGLQTMVTPTGETLPFGIQRRMVIARMLIGKPDILLLDEAFDGIEDAVKLDIIDKIFKYRFWTVVCVTHDPEIVRRCPTIVVVDDGKVVQTGDPRSLCELRDGTFHSLFPQAQRYFSGEDDHG